MEKRLAPSLPSSYLAWSGHTREVPDLLIAAQPSLRSLAEGKPLEGFARHLTDEQLDRLRRCANGNTLRFESVEIVDTLVLAGYAKEGPGRVVTVTATGHQYLQSKNP